MNSTDEDMERLLLRYFINDEWAARGSQPLSSIFEQIRRPSGWRNSYFDQLATPNEEGAVSAILERMASDGLLRSTISGDSKEPHYEAAYDILKHPRYDYLYPKNDVRSNIEKVIDSANLTDLLSKVEIEDYVPIPASNRIVHLDHNQVAEFEAPITEIIKTLEQDNGDPDRRGFRERLLGQMKAGRELVRSGEYWAYLLYETLVRALGELISRYKNSTISALANALLGAVVSKML